ncbi:hypothetical protein SPHINGO391_350153 [Sphingomonas aurantiaca]|uniref:Uncharacterized protein n=1 Tax=Sphingomonas aurantiaca TaxID=185949 RepID=A0A5E7Y351_9SPHN|nr:hypothetical protein SPHINGO391_350153 [Sphingomonas aurantiaca]
MGPASHPDADGHDRRDGVPARQDEGFEDQREFLRLHESVIECGPLHAAAGLASIRPAGRKLRPTTRLRRGADKQIHSGTREQWLSRAALLLNPSKSATPAHRRWPVTGS